MRASRTCIRGLQCVVRALAGSAGDVCFVSMSSNSFRSFVKPALHVGEQIGGGVGWRASVGRGGIAGGGTTTGGEGCNTPAQADTSIGSASSISPRAIAVGLCFIQDLPQGGKTAGAFRESGGSGIAGSTLQRAQLLRVITLRAGVCALLDGEAVGLQAGEGQRGEQEPAERAGDHISSPSFQGSSGTVWPASECVQSLRNCICPSTTNEWQHERHFGWLIIHS